MGTRTTPPSPGFHRKRLDTMLQDLEILVGTGIRHITHYELNVAGGSDFALNRYHELPTVAQNLVLYHASRRFLEGQGFNQLSDRIARLDLRQSPQRQRLLRGSR